jgi:hypothetical protein
LQRCFRYFERGDAGAQGLVGIKTTGRIDANRQRFHTEKRATPTMTIDDDVGNTGKLTRVDQGVDAYYNSTGDAYASKHSFAIYSTGSANATGIYGNFKADAEL